MITLDSASGNIEIPKVNTFEELMNKIKKVLKINDELFKYLYFSYIDEEENERTRLIPQIYDDFINQDSPLVSIGFLDNLNENIEKKLNELIESNKIRFKKNNNEIILNEKENNEIILNEKENNINNNDKNIKNIEIISNEKDNKENIIIYEKKNINNINKKNNLNDLNNNNDLNLKKYDSDNCFNLLQSDSNINNNDNLKNNNIEVNNDNLKNNNIEVNNDENNIKQLDSSEFNLKEFNNEFSNDIYKLQESMKHSNMEEYKKDKKEEELEFENNVKNIIETNVNSIKNDILNSIIIESSSKKDNKSKKSQNISKDVIVHLGIQCNNCGMLPIVGIRYKCVECDNYNLCSKCEENKIHPHLFYKIKKNIKC